MRTHTRMRMRMRTYAYVCVRMRMRMRTYAYVCVRTYAYVCVRIRVRIRTRIFVLHGTIQMLLLGRVALGAQRPRVVNLSRDDLLVGRSVRLPVCPVHCGKTADRIRMPFGIVGRTGPGMRQVVGLGDRSTRRSTFGGEFGARHYNKWALYGVGVRQRREAALLPNYFVQTC